MSQAFMFAIAVMYFGAAISFAWQGKGMWCSVALSWAIGNLFLAQLSK